MEQDKKRFGQAAWATAAPRLERLKLMLARETLQLMRAKELCLNHKRAEIQGKVSQDTGDFILETDFDLRCHLSFQPLLKSFLSYSNTIF